MKFTTSIRLDHALYTYTLAQSVRPYTLKDTGFTQKTIGYYELQRTLSDDHTPNRQVTLKITINKTLDGAKIALTDQSGLHKIDIFKSESDLALQNSFYFIMDNLCERGLFTKSN